LSRKTIQHQLVFFEHRVALEKRGLLTRSTEEFAGWPLVLCPIVQLDASRRFGRRTAP